MDYQIELILQLVVFLISAGNHEVQRQNKILPENFIPHLPYINSDRVNIKNPTVMDLAKSHFKLHDDDTYDLSEVNIDKFFTQEINQADIITNTININTNKIDKTNFCLAQIILHNFELDNNSPGVNGTVPDNSRAASSPQFNNGIVWKQKNKGNIDNIYSLFSPSMDNFVKQGMYHQILMILLYQKAQL